MSSYLDAAAAALPSVNVSVPHCGRQEGLCCFCVGRVNHVFSLQDVMSFRKWLPLQETCRMSWKRKCETTLMLCTVLCLVSRVPLWHFKMLLSALWDMQLLEPFKRLLFVWFTSNRVKFYSLLCCLLKFNLFSIILCSHPIYIYLYIYTVSIYISIYICKTRVLKKFNLEEANFFFTSITKFNSWMYIFTIRT